MSGTAFLIAKPATIFLVEDDDVDAKAVQRSFVKAKIQNPVVRAVDGLEALEILKGTSEKPKLEHPYLLLVDINMPRLNGIELIEALRSDEALRSAVVFVLTTSKRDEDRMAAYNLNVAGYIVKQNAGEDFLKLVDLLSSYCSVIELPLG